MPKSVGCTSLFVLLRIASQDKGVFSKESALYSKYGAVTFFYKNHDSKEEIVTTFTVQNAF